MADDKGLSKGTAGDSKANRRSSMWSFHDDSERLKT